MICFCWLGFPQYGARAIRAFVKSTDEEVVVVATQPNVPVKGMEELSGCRVIWIDVADTRSIVEIVGKMPRVITVPSWRFKSFDRFRRETCLAGGKTILMSDNNLEYSFRIIAKMLLMRLGGRLRYDGYWVPHKSGRRLMRFFGVPDENIFEGMYSADASLFAASGRDILSRPKKIIFVGQLCDRKNPLRMCEAFRAAKGPELGWSLDLYGTGALKDRIPQGNGIFVHDFLQPEELASKYRDARVFCLPSLEEHWGLVVHEAVLSGCALLLSNRVGAAEDLLEEGMAGFRRSPLIGNGFQVNEMTAYWKDVMKDKGLLKYFSSPIEKSFWPIMVLEEGGIIGMLLFLWFVGSVIVVGIRTSSDCFLICFLTTLVLNLGETTVFSVSANGGLMWVLSFVALAFDVRRNRMRQAMFSGGYMR